VNTALVLNPEAIAEVNKGVYVVVNIPTIEITVKYVPERLKELNIFQKGVSFFLLAGLNKSEEIANAMGIADKEFVDIILAELEYAEYSMEQGGRSVPTHRLISEFAETKMDEDSEHLEMVAFIPVDAGSVKVAGPLSMPVVGSEIRSVGESVRISVGTEGSPLEVDCIVSDHIPLLASMVDRSKAKEWIVKSSAKYSRNAESASATTVEIVSMKHRAFLLKCRLKKQSDSKVVRLSQNQLSKMLHVQFVGNNKYEYHLGIWLEKIATGDIEFFSQLQNAFRDGKQHNEAVLDDVSLENELSEDQAVDFAETQNQTVVATAVRRKPRSTDWLVKLLIRRLTSIEVATLENFMAGSGLIEKEISLRLSTLGSRNQTPKVLPIRSNEMEVILANQMHDELGVHSILGAWLLLESSAVLNEIKHSNIDFVEDLCEIFINPNPNINQELKKSMQTILNVNEQGDRHGQV
jgi:hypothetical protein